MGLRYLPYQETDMSGFKTRNLRGGFFVGRAKSMPRETLNKNKMKKPFIIIAVCIVILLVMGIGGYAFYQYQKEESPGYSLQQLQVAVAAHDTTAALQYIDQDAIANAMWPRFESNTMVLPFYSSVLEQAEISNEQSSTIMAVEQSFYQYVSGNNSPTWVGQILNDVFIVPANKIKITGNTADVPYVFKSGDYKYNINVILTKQKGCYWMITDIQGLELPYGGSGRNEQRSSDVAQIGNALNIYYEKNGNFPTEVTSWSSFEKSLIDVDPTGNFENDPLSGTDYPYYYGTNASGSIFVFGVVLESPPQSTMLGSYAGNLPNGVTWLTGTPPETCGAVTTWCYEYPKR